MLRDFRGFDALTDSDQLEGVQSEELGPRTHLATTGHPLRLADRIELDNGSNPIVHCRSNREGLLSVMTLWSGFLASE